jgi:secondary thiamine-phosphate synthase enzyme
MRYSSHVLTVTTSPGIALFDLTEGVNRLIEQAGLSQGFAVLTSRHTTTAITINENETRLLEDVSRFFTRLVPPDGHYLHNDIHLRACPPDEPENAHSHLLAMLVGSSEVIPVEEGRLALGTYQSVFLVELDGPRDRTVAVQIMGS